MKLKSISYWVVTAMLAFFIGSGGAAELAHVPGNIEGLVQLGYPAYFATIIGFWKVLGAIAILAPGLPRLKEWAYAGFTITILSACYSHFSSGDGWLAAEPLLTIVALMLSYAYRPASRRLPEAMGPGGMNFFPQHTATGEAK